MGRLRNRIGPLRKEAEQQGVTPQHGKVEELPLLPPVGPQRKCVKVVTWMMLRTQTTQGPLDVLGWRLAFLPCDAGALSQRLFRVPPSNLAVAHLGQDSISYRMTLRGKELGLGAGSAEERRVGRGINSAHATDQCRCSLERCAANLVRIITGHNSPAGGRRWCNCRARRVIARWALKEKPKSDRRTISSETMIGRRYRMYPGPEEAAVLARWLGCARAVYNAKHEEEQLNSWLRKAAMTSARVFPPDAGGSAFDFDQRFSHLKPAKTEAPWFHDVPANIYRNAMYQRSQAWRRFFKDPKTVGRPGRRRKGDGDSILLTNELFQFWGAGLILVGTPKHFVGVLPYREHRECGEPNSITISRDKCFRWWVSFAFDDGVAAQSDKEVLAQLETRSDDEIAAQTVGFDRGVRRQIVGSNGSAFGYSEAKAKRFQHFQRRQRALQKKLSRQTKGSKRRERTRLKLARVGARTANLRTDHAHHASRQIVDNPAAQVIVFEDLKLRNMTRRAKAKPAEPQPDGVLRFEANGQKRKRGINRSLLHQALGTVVRFTRYKAARAGKLVVVVDPKGTSQECGCCHHTAPANRSGSKFLCQKCGHTADADANASGNIRERGIAAVLVALGRNAEKPCAEATGGRSFDSPQGADEARRSRHLAA